MFGLVILALSYILSQFFRSCMAVLTPFLTADLGISNADLSIASGAWFFAFAFMQFAVGVSLDRYGPRLTASVILAVFGATGAFLFATAHGAAQIIVAMAFIGAGCSPLFMASLYIFARIYSPRRFAILSSWLVAFGTAGNVMGASPLAEAAEAFGWRPVLSGLGVITLAIALMILLFVQDPPKTEGEKDSGFGFAGFADVLKIRSLWLLLPMVFVCYAPLAGIRGLWAGPFLADVYGADALTIGHVTSSMAIGMILGSFFYGPLDSLLGTRKWVVFGGNIVFAGLIAWLTMHPLMGISSVTWVFFAMGLFGTSYAVMITHGRAFLPAHLVGRGVTFLNFVSMISTSFFQLIAGWIVTEYKVPDAPEVAYQVLFGFYVIVLVSALAIYLFSKDARLEKQ